MAMKPIIFSTPMVQAILNGCKTQTRRVMKPQPRLETYRNPERDFWIWEDCNWLDGGLGFPKSGIEDYAPYKPGDILWVREAFWVHNDDPLDSYKNIIYDADYGDGHKTPDRWLPQWYNRKPSITMPKAAARIYLRVTDVKVERVQEILCGDMKAEGCIPAHIKGGQWQQWQRDYFEPMWNRTNAKRGYPWHANPWVWKIEFERTEKP